MNQNPEIIVSLHGFCRDHDIPKSSAHALIQDWGESAANGLSPEVQDRLLSHFGKTQKPEEDRPRTVTVLAGGGLVPRRSFAIAPMRLEYETPVELAELEDEQRHNLGALDSLLSQYAAAKMLQAVGEIDHAVETIKSNAIAAAAHQITKGMGQ